MRVLLVDDEENVLRSLGRLFRRRPDITLVTALTIEEALRALEQSPFDAAIVDQHLGSGSRGGDLLEEVAVRWPATRRVLCSGGSMNARDDQAERAAHAVLVKPCPFDAVLSALRDEAIARAV